MFAAAQNRGNADQQLDPPAWLGCSPRAEGLVRRGDRSLGILAGSLRKAADDLRGPGRVDRFEALRGAGLLAADVVFPLDRQTGLEGLQRLGERPRIGRIGKIGQGLVLEFGKQDGATSGRKSIPSTSALDRPARFDRLAKWRSTTPSPISRLTAEF